MGCNCKHGLQGGMRPIKPKDQSKKAQEDKK